MPEVALSGSPVACNEVAKRTFGTILGQAELSQIHLKNHSQKEKKKDSEKYLNPVLCICPQRVKCVQARPTFLGVEFDIQSVAPG